MSNPSFGSTMSDPPVATVRGTNMHMACMTPDETLLTIIFVQKKHVPDAPCPRCGVNLRETPDP